MRLLACLGAALISCSHQGSTEGPQAYPSVWLTVNEGNRKWDISANLDRNRVHMVTFDGRHVQVSAEFSAEDLRNVRELLTPELFIAITEEGYDPCCVPLDEEIARDHGAVNLGGAGGGTGEPYVYEGVVFGLQIEPPSAWDDDVQSAGFWGDFDDRVLIEPLPENSGKLIRQLEILRDKYWELGRQLE